MQGQAARRSGLLKTAGRTTDVRCVVEALEDRALLNATPSQIAAALDLPGGTNVSFSGDARALATRSLSSFGGLFGFPSGADNDFLVVSTGVADEIDALAHDTVDQHGTDLGPPGVDGDGLSVTFTLTVTSRGDGRAQYLALDAMMLTEESLDQFNDSRDDASVYVNGVNITDTGDDQVGDDFPNSLSTEGTYFNQRSNAFTFRYLIPLGVTQLNIEMVIYDEVDGDIDTAVLVDNVRIEQPQVVYLNFDGADVGDFFGPGTSMQIRPFETADVTPGPTDRANLIEFIRSQMLGLTFTTLNIFFVTTPPTEGPYATIVIGGSNDDELAIDPLKQPFAAFEFGASASVHDFYDLADHTMYGRAQSVDIGNRDQNDTAVVFSAEFAPFGGEGAQRLANTIAHEVGHLLGLRHVDDASAFDEIMRREVGMSAQFNDAPFGLAELTWPDGATQQNSAAYLASVLGRNTGDYSRVLTASSGAKIQDFYTFELPKGKQLFDVDVVVYDAEDDDAGAATLHYASVVGAMSVPLPVQFRAPTIALLASSTLGGPRTVTTGTPLSGPGFKFRDTRVPLRGIDTQIVPELTLSQGTAVNGFTPFAVVSVSDNPFNEVTIVPGNKGVFTDTDGDLITLTLSGPGHLAVVPDGAVQAAQVIMDSTTSKSALTVKVKKTTGDGRVTLLGIAGGTLKSITATVVDFDGTGLVFGGPVGTVKIGDLRDGAGARFSADGAPPAGSKMTFVARSMAGGGSFSFPGLVSAFTSGAIDGASITAGVFGAFKAANVTGSTITAGGADAKGVSLKSLKALRVSDARLTAPGSIGSIGVLDWLNGDDESESSINAASIGTMTVSGNAKLGVRGDLEGLMVLTDEVLASALKKLTVKGLFTNGAMIIHGSAGAMAFGGIVGAGVGVGIDLAPEEFQQVGEQGFPPDDAGLFTGGLTGVLKSLTVAKPSATSGFSLANPNLGQYGVVARVINKLNMFVGFADGQNGGVTLGVATTFIGSASLARADRKFSTASKLDAAKLVSLVSGDPTLIFNDQPGFVDFGIDADAGTSLNDSVLRLYRA